MTTASPTRYAPSVTRSRSTTTWRTDDFALGMLALLPIVAGLLVRAL